MATEIFELSAYVVDSSATSPDLAVFATEIRTYAVQQATSKNAAVVTEIGGYAIQRSGHRTKLVANGTSMYVIVPLNTALNLHDNTRKTLLRTGGLALSRLSHYTIEPAENAAGISQNARSTTYRDAGLAHFKTTMITIEVP